MAELSDSDKMILLGKDYKEIERQAQISRGLSESQEIAEARRGKYSTYRTTAAVSAGLAALVFVTNFRQASGPYQPNLGIVAGIAVLLGVAIALYAHVLLRKEPV